MFKVEYKNEMPYTYHAENPRNHYLIDGANGFCNKGNFCESAAKFHRGLAYLTNPSTAALDGYDIPEEKAEVKSGAGGLGRKIGELDFTVSQQIRYYFQHKPADSKWIWIVFNDKTQMVTEYHMNKSEFGAFLHIALRSRQHLQSNKKSINVRFKNTSKKMLAWLDERCA
jgi:hypothetical protein